MPPLFMLPTVRSAVWLNIASKEETYPTLRLQQWTRRVMPPPFQSDLRDRQIFGHVGLSLFVARLSFRALSCLYCANKSTPPMHPHNPAMKHYCLINPHLRALSNTIKNGHCRNVNVLRYDS